MSLMRTLFVSNVVPWPTDAGIKLRVYHLLRALARVSDVTLACFTHPAERADARHLQSLASKIILLSRESCAYRELDRLPRPRRIARTVLEYSHPTRPAALTMWQSAEASMLMQALALTPTDVVWVESLGLTPLLSHFPQARHIVDLADIQYRALGHRLRRGIWDRLLPLDCLEYLRLRRFEQRLPRHVDDVVVCSDTDRGALGSAGNVHVIPNGITLPTTEPPPRSPSTPPVLLFVGTLSYAPNVDAVQFFSSRVLPLIRRRIPTIRFHIVGGDPPPAIRRLHDGERIIVTGRVPSVEPYLAQADTVIAPIRFGGGSRIKILEALAHRVAVVTTTMGAEGLTVESGRHLLIADTASAFSDACLTALTDPGLRARLTHEGHRLVTTNYDWTVIERQIEAFATGEKIAAASLADPVGGRR
jgi:glycosyltransferase involved in cell wall biosynthesis